MDGNYLLGVAFGITAALMLNVGKGIQKYKIHVFLQGRKILSRAHRGDLGIWMVGFLITIMASIPFSLGLKFSQSPSTISAMTGIGLIGLTLFAVKIIREKLTVLDFMGITLVVCGTSLLAYIGSEKEILIRMLDDRLLIRSVSPILGFFAVCCAVALKIPRIHGVVFGMTAGFCLGITLFFGDVALVKADGNVLAQFSNPYPYAAIAFALTTTVVTQLGFLKGRALEVVPALNSFTIITPLFFERVIYKIQIPPSTFFIIALLLIGVVLLSLGSASRAAQ